MTVASPTHSAVHSRSLLFTDTDVFGNVVDPESGRVISTAPRHSPLVSSSVLEPPGTTEDIGTLLGLGDVMEPRLGNVMEPRLGDVMEPRLGDGMELRLGDGMEPRITSTAESLSRDVRIDVGEEH